MVPYGSSYSHPAPSLVKVNGSGASKLFKTKIPQRSGVLPLDTEHFFLVGAGGREEAERREKSTNLKQKEKPERKSASLRVSSTKLVTHENHHLESVVTRRLLGTCFWSWPENGHVYHRSR
jgi:hypothetical protein